MRGCWLPPSPFDRREAGQSGSSTGNLTQAATTTKPPVCQCQRWFYGLEKRALSSLEPFVVS